ncbi:CG31642, partial [Drosophila busckii]
MAAANHLVDRHNGYVCCKCKRGNFVGRRYSCWVCLEYQLCGRCYDAGEPLPQMRQHKYFHPLDVHYTRKEYELYFAGEDYVEANAPQSLKCALCEICGLTSIQLYKHLNHEHRTHADFNDYFRILYARYEA